jgi:transposase
MDATELWARRVKEWRSSGLSARQFVECADYSEGSLRYWASRLKRSRPSSEPEAVRVVRVVHGADDRAETPDTGARVQIEVGEARVSVGAGLDRATLRMVLEVLRELERERAR